MLRKLNQTYLPFEYGPSGEGVFCYGQGAVEQIAYDAASARLFAVGGPVRGYQSITCARALCLHGRRFQ